MKRLLTFTPSGYLLLLLLLPLLLPLLLLLLLLIPLLLLCDGETKEHPSPYATGARWNLKSFVISLWVSFSEGL